MLLTPHFCLEEFAVSREHPHLARDIAFSDIETERIRFACASILEPIRLHFDKPVVITSGKRTEALNRAVGGHPQSHHLYLDDTGACDIVVAGVSPSDIAAWIIARLRVAYLIVYRRGFLHISFPNVSGQYNLVHYKE